MKKLLAVLQFVFLSSALLYAVPWNTYEEETSDARGYQYKRSVVLAKAMAGEEIRVNIEYDYTPTDRENNFYKDQVNQALNAWFFVAAKMIEDSGREEEFENIYPIVARGINIHFTISNPVVTVLIHKEKKTMQEICGEKALACYTFATRELDISRVEENNPKKEFMRNLTHEFGHALGLADQYEAALYKDKEISRRYGSPQENMNSIMNYRREKVGNKISPDDVDGLINVMDLELIAQGKPSIVSPWRGFAGNYTYYQGEALEKNEQSASFEKFTLEEERENNNKHWSIKYHVPGRKSEEHLFSLTAPDTPVDIETVIRDPILLEGEVIPFGFVTGVGPNDESVACYDLYRKTACFGMMPGEAREVAWVQVFVRDELYGEKPIRRVLIFKKEDVLVEMAWYYNQYKFIDFFVREFIPDEEDPFYADLLTKKARDINEKNVTFAVRSKKKESVSLASENSSQTMRTKAFALAVAPSPEIIKPFMRE